MRRKMQLMFLLATLGLTVVAIAAGVDSPQPASDASFTAHTFPKSSDFSSLEDWVSHNYTEYLLGEVRPTTVGDLEAVTFRGNGDKRTDFNLLFDNGESLILVTTSRISSSQADRPGSSPEMKAATCDTSTNRCNCVLYARCKVPSLPYGLHTYRDKAAIINSTSATTGSVAIMNINAPVGHVAFVTAVKKDIQTRRVTSITVTEANYRSCQITTRSGSPESMKVTGYFRP